MDDYISRKTVTVGLDYIINALNKLITDDSSNDVYTDIKNQVEEIKRGVLNIPPADVQPVTFCKDCQWLADIKDVETGELYHTCGVLAFDVPDGFACNQGKRKGAEE